MTPPAAPPHHARARSLAHSNFRPPLPARPPPASALDESLAPRPTSSTSNRTAIPPPQRPTPATESASPKLLRCVARRPRITRPTIPSSAPVAVQRGTFPRSPHQCSSEFPWTAPPGWLFLSPPVARSGQHPAPAPAHPTDSLPEIPARDSNTAERAYSPAAPAT